jgi:hypothetical protein
MHTVYVIAAGFAVSGRGLLTEVAFCGISASNKWSIVSVLWLSSDSDWSVAEAVYCRLIQSRYVDCFLKFCNQLLNLEFEVASYAILGTHENDRKRVRIKICNGCGFIRAIT